jgi:prepilin-type N-terminal cleavage/methylation domain-containing protein
MKNKKKLSKKAFTLIELLVVIAIITIMLIWMSSLNFKWQEDKEELEKKVNKVINIFENIKTNSLLWKAEKNYEIPTKRKITFATWSNNEFILEKFYLTWATWKSIQKTTLKKPWFFVRNFYCSELNDPTSTWSFSNTWEIIFEWRNIYLSGSECSDEKYQKLEINFRLRNFNKKIIFNTLSWNIEKKNIK